VIIAGAGATKRAAARGHNHIYISTSVSSILESYQTTVNLLEYNSEQNRNASILLTVMSVINDGLIIVDIDNRIVQLNHSAELLLSRRRDAVVGRSVLELVPELETFLKTTENSEHIQIFKRREREYALTIKAINFKDSDRMRLLTITDIAALRTTEQKIRYQMVQNRFVAKYTFGDILTNDPEVLRQIDRAKSYAVTDSTVIIYGESGTGKELFAQSIVNYSPRKGHPFVAVNCAALTESLLESELFGYVEGAFTGAKKGGKAGLFELADGGTIFLDEINSMSPGTQSKLLRVLEEHEIMRVGSDYIIPINVRVICACNEDLFKNVKEGKFRKDLFYRLNVLTLRLPSLDERPGDIIYLFRRFVAQLSGSRISDVLLPDALESALLRRRWPGNIRELKNTAERYILLGDELLEELSASPENGILREADSSITPAPAGRIDLKELSHTVEQLVIQQLEQSGMSKTEIAKSLGLSRAGLYKKMKQPPRDG
jgi:propionate catabolism operon transcriptional regulator